MSKVSEEMESLAEMLDYALLRVAAQVLDAVVDAGLIPSEEQYVALLLEAGKRLKSTACTLAYPEAVEAAALRFVREEKLKRAGG